MLVLLLTKLKIIKSLGLYKLKLSFKKKDKLLENIDKLILVCYNIRIPLWGDMEAKMERHEHTKAVLNRISRAAGHLNAVKKMIEDGRDCSDVLIQLSAVKAEIVNTSKIILKDHIDHCIADAVKNNDEETVELLKKAVDRIL